MRLISRGLAMLAATALSLGAAQAQRAPSHDEAEKAAGDKSKMICKRFVRTGSLVDGYRACKTKGDWEREREALRQLVVSDSCRARAEGGGC